MHALKIIFAAAILSSCGPTIAPHTLNQDQEHVLNHVVLKVLEKTGVDMSGVSVNTDLDIVCNDPMMYGCASANDVLIKRVYSEVDPVHEKIKGQTFCTVLVHELMHSVLMIQGKDADENHSDRDLFFGFPVRVCNEL